MVSCKCDGPAGALVHVCPQAFEHVTAVFPPVHVVSDKDDKRIGIGVVDIRQQAVQQIDPAMDVSNGPERVRRRQGCVKNTGRFGGFGPILQESYRLEKPLQLCT